MVASPDAVRALVEPALSQAGLELWDVEITRDELRILVDRPGGVDLDALASVAGRVVSPLLDEHPEVTPDGPFQLQVSSPGVERTLRRPDQYARYIGTPISVKTTVAVAGARRHHGTLVAVDERAVTIAPADDPDGATVELAHADIDRARTVLVWGPAGPGAARDGGAPRKGAPQKGASKKGAQREATARQLAGRQAVKRPAASGRQAGTPVASNEPKDSRS